MILKKACTAVLGATLLAWAGMSAAAEYRGSEFLSLDLSKAVLSPTPLGPPAQFAPVRIEDSSGDFARQARVEPNAGPGKATSGAHVRGTKLAARAEKPRGAARIKLARRHGNPLDAEAFDTRIQVWPCNTGGICNWQRH